MPLQRSPPPGSSPKNITINQPYLQPHEMLKILCQTGSEGWLKADFVKKLANEINAHSEGADFIIEDTKTAPKITLKYVEYYNQKDIMRMIKFQNLVKKIIKADPNTYNADQMIQSNKLSNKKLFSKGHAGDETNIVESSTIQESANRYSEKAAHESNKLRNTLLNRTNEMPTPSKNNDNVSQDWMANQFANITTNFNQKFGGIEKSIDSINGYIKTFITSEEALALADETGEKIRRELTEKIEKVETTNEANELKMNAAIAEAVKLELQTQFSEGSAYEIPRSEASQTRNLTENQILVLANRYTTEGAEYRTAVFNNKRSGILQFTLMNEIQGGEEDKIWSYEMTNDETKFKLNFSNLRKLVDNTNFANLEGGKARLSKKNNMVVKLKITGLNGYNTSEKIKKIMMSRETMDGVAITILPPIQYDIDSILISWKTKRIITKFEINRGGFYTLNVNDGNENLTGGNFHRSCTRLNISNPRAVAGIYEPTIPALRAIAAGTHFAAEGQVVKFPENFFKLPVNPGKVNDTWSPNTEDEAKDMQNYTGNHVEPENKFTEI